jgi:glycosyltransferase involved in cell wall biosynthesis
MLRVLIQGWRFLPHSYAMVNQFQCLEMLRRPQLQLWHEDVPYFIPRWRAMRGLFDQESEARLSAMPPLPPRPADGDAADVTYRIAYPYNFGPSNTRWTVVFGTAEHAVVPPEMIAGGITLADAMAQAPETTVIVTPSNWSRDGFIASGADPRRVYVVPHGVEPAIYHPLPTEERESMRAARQWQDLFIFLHVGAMTGNKNLPLLLRALAVVAEHHPQARLLLKGLDALYPSQHLLNEASKSLTQAQLALVQTRLNYFGGVLPLKAMAAIYQMADAYVSPYAAEGFNLPVLEAAACGVPIVCTRGGSTDDFTTPQFALGVDADIVPEPQSNGNPAAGRSLAVRFDSLVEQMRRAIDDSAFTTQARAIAPGWVSQRFSWANVGDQLMKVLSAAPSDSSAAPSLSAALSAGSPAERRGWGRFLPASFKRTRTPRP